MAGIPLPRLRLVEPIFFGLTSVPISSCPDILHVDITLFVQITKERGERFKSLMNVLWPASGWDRIRLTNSHPVYKRLIWKSFL